MLRAAGWLGASLAIGSILSPTIAVADDSGSASAACSKYSALCFVKVERPGTAGSGAGGQGSDGKPSGSSRAKPDSCRDSVRDKEVPCTDPDRGVWDGREDCYYSQALTQPPKGDPIWQGHTDGAIYVEVCPWLQGAGALVWRPSPSLKNGGSTVSPQELAQQAIDKLKVKPPKVQIIPKAEDMGLVGLPYWMWVDPTPSNWGPLSATASIPGLSVTATAKVKSIVWDMGDGHKVTCTTPGTPFRISRVGKPSPDCGYMYEQASYDLPDQKYTVTATSTWQVVWEGGGQSGQALLKKTTTLHLFVAEVQVLIS